MSATHSGRLDRLEFLRAFIQFRTDTRILGPDRGGIRRFTPRRLLLIDRPTHSEIIFHFTWAAPRRTGPLHAPNDDDVLSPASETAAPFSARLTWGSLPTYFCVALFSMIDDSGGHLWLLFAAEFLIRPPTERF
jgi:hypothetical protein